MKAWSSFIQYSVHDSGAEFETKEEYIQYVKDTFRDSHDIELADEDITDIESEELA
jgi:predicted NAD-dependent protein-ADP-ribosyltransferase YbiA (DUF1768 family)